MKSFDEQNYYELLDISPQAPSPEVESGYQRALSGLGPESAATYSLFQPEELALLRKRIREAYEVLKDPQRRRQYNQSQSLPEFELELEQTLGEGGSRQEGFPVEMERSESLSREAALPRAPEPGEVAEVVRSEETATDAGVAERSDAVADIAKAPVEAATVAPAPSPAPAAVPAAPPVQAAPSPLPAAPTAAANTCTPLMPEINEHTEYSGALLKQVREARKLTLEKIADVTKISIYYLRMMEGDHYEDLPAPVYVKGYLRHVAKFLGLNPQAVVDGYTKRMEPPLAKK